MKTKLTLILLFFAFLGYSQTIDLNKPNNYSILKANTLVMGTDTATGMTSIDSITHSIFKQTQLTGSLTDGTPTDAEIDAIIGTTPAVVGIGYRRTIKDSDGTGLLYRIESDGTNWFYWVSVTAL